MYIFHYCSLYTYVYTTHTCMSESEDGVTEEVIEMLYRKASKLVPYLSIFIHLYI